MRTLAEHPGRDLTATSFEGGFLFAWRRTDETIVVQARPRTIGNAPDEVWPVHEIGGDGFLHAMTWVEEGAARWLVYRVAPSNSPSTAVRAVRFAETFLVPLPAPLELDLRGLDDITWLAGGPGGRLGFLDVRETEGTLRMAVATLTEGVERPPLDTIADEAALYDRIAFSRSGDQVAAARQGADLDNGPFVFRRGTAAWQGARLTALAPGGVGPVFATDELVVFSATRGDDVERLFVRRLGCEM